MDRLPDPEVDMYRKCARCKQKVWAIDPPHMCKDVRQRLQKREKQRDAVVQILLEYIRDLDVPDIIPIAEQIVEKLMKMGVEDD